MNSRSGKICKEKSVGQERVAGWVELKYANKNVKVVTILLGCGNRR